MDQQSASGDAGLAGGGEDAGHDAVDGRIDAASGKMMFGDFPPSSRVTSAMWSAALFITAMPVAVDPVKVTLSTPGSSGQRAPRLAGAGDHVEDARREPGLVNQLGELQRRRRCLLGGFGDDGASGGQGGRQLARQQKQRAVPGQDGGDDADGLAAGVGEEVGLRRGDGVTENLVGGAGEEFVRWPAVRPSAPRVSRITLPLSVVSIRASSSACGAIRPASRRMSTPR